MAPDPLPRNPMAPPARNSMAPPARNSMAPPVHIPMSPETKAYIDAEIQKLKDLIIDDTAPGRSTNASDDPEELEAGPSSAPAEDDPWLDFPERFKNYVDVALIRYRLKLVYENNKRQDQYLQTVNASLNNMMQEYSRYVSPWWDEMRAARQKVDQQMEYIEKEQLPRMKGAMEKACGEHRAHIKEEVVREMKDQLRAQAQEWLQAQKRGFDAQVGILQKKVVEVDNHMAKSFGNAKDELDLMSRHVKGFDVAAREWMKQYLMKFERRFNLCRAQLRFLNARMPKTKRYPRRLLGAGTKKKARFTDYRVTGTRDSIRDIAMTLVHIQMAEKKSTQAANEDSDEWIDEDADEDADEDSDYFVLRMPHALLRGWVQDYNNAILKTTYY